MSLDKLLYDVDLALVGVTEGVERLLTVLTIFVPIFIIGFGIFVILLVALLIVSIFLQFKRLRMECQERRRATAQNGIAQRQPMLIPPKAIDSAEDSDQQKTPKFPGIYRRVGSDPRLELANPVNPSNPPVPSQPIIRVPISLMPPKVIEPRKERRFPIPSSFSTQQMESRSPPSQNEDALEKQQYTSVPMPIPITMIRSTNQESRIWLPDKEQAPANDEHNAGRDQADGI